MMLKDSINNIVSFHYKIKRLDTIIFSNACSGFVMGGGRAGSDGRPQPPSSGSKNYEHSI